MTHNPVAFNKFVGAPCKHGHGGLRWTRNSECVVCTTARGKQHKQSALYKQKQRAYAAERAADPAFRAAANAKAVAKTAARRAANPEKYEIAEIARRKKCSDLGKTFRGARHIAVRKDESFYRTGKPCKQGHVAARHTVSGTCVACVPLKSRKAYWSNPSKYRALAATYAKTAGAVLLRAARYAALSTEKKSTLRAAAKARARLWRKENRAHATHLSTLNKKAVKTRTPAWADKDAIRLFYKRRPEGHHVDHIIPLSGRTVSGLHVLENLQYLPAVLNLRKNRSFPADGVEHVLKGRK